MDTTLTSGPQRNVSPWDKWNRKNGNEHTWHAMRVSRLASNKERFLDLGCGYGRNSRFLLEKGFEEGIGVDKYPMPKEICCTFAPSRFSFVESTIEQFVIPSDSFGAIIAAHSLYFCDKEKLLCVFMQVLKGLCRGGIFACNLLDVHDPWASSAPVPVSLVKTSEVADLIRGFKILEYKQTKTTTWKAWHNHDLVLEKI